MIEIRVETDKTSAAEYLCQNGASACLADKTVMCVYDSGRLAGVGAVSIAAMPDAAVIEDIVCENGLDFAMGRALLNLLDQSGINKVFCENKRLYPLAEKLLFSKSSEAGKLELDLEGYFGHGCG